MGIYKYIRESWKEPSKELDEIWKQRIISWRTEPSTIRIPKPTRLDRARSLGYKAKPGILIVRQRVLRGGRMRPKNKAGRRPKHFRSRKIVGMNYQWIAEQRAAKKFMNCEVLNSYFLAQDGTYYWYEIILADRNHPVVLADSRLNWVHDKANYKRVFRGITSAGRKSRGLRWKGKGAEKMRPSISAHDKLGK